MKLTKLQRYTAYCIMLEINSTEGDPSICSLLRDSFSLWAYGGDCPSNYTAISIRKTFPELYNNRINRNDDYWWNNWKERRVALLKCIELTHP